MGNAADNLVKKYPDRISQLKCPILAYFKKWAKIKPFNGTEQDLYMTVFHPVSRQVPPDTVFPANVRKDNPGIKTPQDYINLVNGKKNTAILTPAEWTALKDTASKLGTSSTALYKLINFESSWAPQARNPISGARGLIQWMPFVAKEYGFKDDLGGMTPPLLLALLLGGGYFIARRYGLI